MRIAAIMNRVSKRAPTIVIAILCAALAGSWAGAPGWLGDGLAAVVVLVALAVFAARRRQRRPLRVVTDDPGDLTLKEKMAFELEGAGTPPGFYLLGFFAFLTMMLAGFQTPFGRLALAALALSIAWGLANVEYPEE